MSKKPVPLGADGVCPFCGSEPMFEIVEVWGHDYLPGACCEQAQVLLEDFTLWDPADRRQFFTEALGGTQGVIRGVTTDYQIDYYVDVRDIKQKAAFKFIDEVHEHHPPPQGWKFGLAAWNGPTLVGVATVGLPVSRVLMQRKWLEVTRLATPRDEARYPLTRHVASQLYAACRKEARRLGAPRICTYTLKSEPGTTLVAAGFEKTAEVKGRSWDTPSRRRTDKHPTVDKVRWEAPT